MKKLTKKETELFGRILFCLEFFGSGKVLLDGDALEREEAKELSNIIVDLLNKKKV
jgi:hypothetical protein